MFLVPACQLLTSFVDMATTTTYGFAVLYSVEIIVGQIRDSLSVGPP
jgi:hypothetical protein